MIKRALVSVSDKTGIVAFVKELADLGVEIISTGGTAKVLTEAGIAVKNVSDITGYPECLDGRVKTLHPAIHGGLLAIRSNKDHMAQIERLGIKPIDMVIVNLYPFKQTIMKEGVSLEEAIENIDIGGPAMLRAAAKNYQDVVVLTDPSDYAGVLSEISSAGDCSIGTKFRLAYKVFEHTGYYDALISQYLKKKMGDASFPPVFTMTFEKAQDLRYGENPHQNAIFYKEVAAPAGSIVNAKQLHGKELSYNNINDANGALELLREFKEPTVIAVKHANPCGVGCAADICSAYLKAYDSDPVSIFGGIIAANREIDTSAATEINKIFIEIVIAPSFSKEAFSILSQKKNIRLLELPDIASRLSCGSLDMKKVAGGLLVQQYDSELLNQEDIKYVTEARPDDQQMEDLIFAMKVVKHAKSNAIVIAAGKQTLGIGPGQLNRITAAKIAIDYAGDKARGAVMASDAYFPFPDCVEAAAEAGVKAIIQPGGSQNDQKSIDACNKAGIAMIFTGMRHFKH